MSPETGIDTQEKTENLVSDRWQKAQSSELAFWEERARSPIDEDSSVGLAGKAYGLLSKLNIPLDEILQNSVKILDLGCGPMGFNIGLYYLAKASELQCPTLTNLDPLIHEYRDIYPNFRGITEADVVSIDELPSNAKFDYIVLENVIDHISEPRPIINQLRARLTDSGKLLVTCHTIPNLLQPTEPILNAIDPPHPHHFTHQYLEKMLEDSGYSVTTSFVVNLRECHPEFSLSTFVKQRSLRWLKRYSATWILNTSFIVAEAKDRASNN